MTVKKEPGCSILMLLIACAIFGIILSDIHAEIIKTVGADGIRGAEKMYAIACESLKDDGLRH